MRKVLFGILALVLLIVIGLVIYRGFSIGNYEVWGIKQIKEEDEKIDRINAQLGELANAEFNTAKKGLEESGEKMQEEKKKYEEQAITVSNSKYYMQTEKYKIDFLWTRIGNYAKDNKTTIKMEVTNTSTKGVYNLIITAVGNYHNVADFIYSIENDSRLGFKIEEFSMTGSSDDEKSNKVQGRFVCKDIRIDIKSIDSDSTTKNSTKTAEDNSEVNGENTPEESNDTPEADVSKTENTTDATNMAETNAENTTNTVEGNTTDTEPNSNTSAGM